MIDLKLMWQKEDTVALALSGGIDSMVLYDLLTTRYKDTYRKLYIVHVNHGVRMESFNEEKLLRKRVERDGYTFLTTTLNLEHFTQQAGRIARYQFFKEMIASRHIDYLLTAHHADDDYESIMFEIFTNRHLHGLGIPKVNDKVIRPMLHVRLKEIEAYAEEHDIEFFLDESNETNDYTRNYIRHEVLSNIESNDHLHVESLHTFKTDFNALVEFVKKEAVEFLNEPFKRSKFNEKSHILKLYILSEWLNVSRTYIEEIIRRLESTESQFELPIGTSTFVCSYDACYVTNEMTDYETSLTINEDGTYIFNGYKITVAGLKLFVRTFKAGDRVKIKNVGTKKLSRMFIDKKIPKEKRHRMPIIIDENGVIVAVGEIYNIINILDNMHINLNVEEIINDTEK